MDSYSLGELVNLLAFRVFRIAFVENHLELLKAEHSILLNVVCLHDFLDFSLRNNVAQLLEGVVHVLLGDLAGLVRVKHREHTLELSIVKESFNVDCGRQKLSVIDLAIAIGIKLVH